MVNQYMRVRLEEIEEQAETINISILFRYDWYCFSTILQTLKEHFHVLLLSTRDDKDNRKNPIADVGNKKGTKFDKIMSIWDGDLRPIW